MLPHSINIDTGLLNAMTFRNSYNKGLLLESIVFMHLRRNDYEVEYVNSQNGLETDFFARHKISGDVKLIQSCWDMTDKKTFSRELKGLQSAMEKFSIPAGTIVTWDDEKTLDNQIDIIPIWKWLLTVPDLTSDTLWTSGPSAHFTDLVKRNIRKGQISKQ